MANVQHSELTGDQVHEPKGIATAELGQVYIANGSNSGVWKFPSGFAYGELFITEGATPQTLLAASASNKLNPTGEWTRNGNSNITVTPADGTLTILQGGEYSLTFYTTFTTASIASGSEYRFYYAVNGVHSTRNTFVRKTTNGVETLHCSASGLATFATNDVVSMYVKGGTTSSGTAITIVEAGFNCILIQPDLL